MEDIVRTLHIFTLGFLLAGSIGYAEGIPPCIKRQELTARQPGVVQSYLVSDGQSVKKGDVLIELDSRLQRAGVKESEGAVEAAAANVALAKDAVKRLEKLKGTDAIADNQLIESQIRLMQASALLKQATGAHERAKIQLEDTRIRASLSGIVRGIPSVLGLAVQAGQSLGRIDTTQCDTKE